MASTFAQTPPRNLFAPKLIASPMNPTDVSRALDLLLNYFLCDMRQHPLDFAELQQLSATIRNSANNL
jgi:hypothetical protein